MARETGKQRSQRIQIDYYRQRGRLYVGRYLCALIGLVAAALYSLYVIAAGGSAQVITGPVAQAHAAFESDCQQCHLEFTPIDSRAVKLDIPLANIRPTASLQHLESACQKCHAVGSHHRMSMNATGQLADQNCGHCHGEHKGRDHDLVLLTNRQCLSCHEQLADVCPATTVRGSVVDFTEQGHGDFASLAKPDPGKVKFDHRQHMLPGQVNEGEKGGMTIGMLDPSARLKYRREGQDDASLVQLECASCHQLSGMPGDGRRLSADAELGRYLAPISYEQHCAACHAMNPGIATGDTTPLPHAVEWSKIELLLRGTLAGARASGQSRSPRDDSQSSPQPGKGAGGFGAAASLVAADEVAAARARVESQCLQCHDRDSITDQRIHSAVSSEPMIPPRWFARGLYDHAAHRQIDCRYCHQQAYPTSGSPAPPEDHRMVMIAGIDSCTGCHRDAESPTPASVSSPDVVALLGGQATWASDACTLCHRYHVGTEER